MQMTPYRISASDEPVISFPLLECWNPMTQVATVAAQVRGQRVLCRISLSVLQKRFRASEAEPMQTIVENRSVIEAAARKLIEHEAYEEDGSILIRDRDI